MISQAKNSVFKHLDFIVLDLICLQVSFVLSFVLLVNAGNPYSVILYRYQIIIFNVIQLLMDFFLEPYKNILRRNTLQEIWANPRYQKTREVIGRDREDWPFCRGCDFVDSGIRNTFMNSKMLF